MKKKLLYLLCVVITVACMCGIYYIADRVLIVKRTDGILPMQDFYAQKEDTVDVLLLGSSHTGMNLDVSEFWIKKGQSAYALWGSIQPFWNSYHFLVEALKTQHPKAVVLDVYAATFDFEYSDRGRQVVNLCGMRPSMNKWEAIKVSAPKDRWFNLMAGMPAYHNRYWEIDAEDFQHFPWNPELVNDKGTYYRYNFGPSLLMDVSDVTETAPLMEKEEVYLRKIIELCQDKNIPIILILTPTATARDVQPVMNTVAIIAEEYEIPFYNFNLIWDQADCCELDFNTDGGHLNTRGARKISGWLAARLQEDYDLPDRRGDPVYLSWDAHAQNIEEEYIKLITRNEDYFEELNRNGYDIIVVSITETVLQSDNGKDIAEYLGQTGINVDEICYGYMTCWTYSQQGDAVSLTEQMLENDNFRFEFDGTIWDIETCERWEVMCNGETQSNISEHGIYIFVIDPQQSKCIDVAMFPENNDFAIAHN